MEIMEDGNLVDRVRILLQRDMEYYQEKQTVLKEPLCIRISGGKLDFPRHASLAAIKIVSWWETDFQAAFKCQSGLSSSEKNGAENAEGEAGVIKKIQPAEFILLVVDTAEQLLEHLHTLIQECLDHADLTVLTATLGAAALIRNCLWCYSQHSRSAVSPQTSEKMNKSYKSFHEMAEAVAERLLDLHCRLISLYVLNEADSLSWHKHKPFFEKERCSFVIQMWWLYMQGTKSDLWNTVPPKMAQRVFSGMLNDSLSIIVTRFVHGQPTLQRSQQFWADAFNVLCCTGYLGLAACVNSDEMLGSRLNKLPTAVRDIHAKCNELLISLLLRGTPLDDLYQACRDGFEKLAILQARRGPSPWLLVCAPNLVGSTKSDVYVSNLPEDRTVILELNLLRHQPQPNWPQIMRVLSMDNYVVARILLRTLVLKCVGLASSGYERSASSSAKKTCGGFLCSSTACDKALKITPGLGLYSIVYILAISVKDPERVIVPALKLNAAWSSYLDRQQVWNQSRPPWLAAMLDPVKEMMGPVVETLLDAVKTGASIYQAMSLVIGCFTELYVTLPIAILRTALALGNNIPAHCHPIGGDVLLQILCVALYSALLVHAAKHDGSTDGGKVTDGKNGDPSIFDPNDVPGAALALAEAVCSIDEDNKHTAQIDDFCGIVKEFVARADENPRGGELEIMPCIIETHTDELLFSGAGRRSVKVIHELLVRSSDSLLNNLRSNNREASLTQLPERASIEKPLTYTMFHIEDELFDQFFTKHETTNWKRILTLPLSVTLERARSQILLRPEFKNPAGLSPEDRENVNSIKRILASVKTQRC